MADISFCMLFRTFVQMLICTGIVACAGPPVQEMSNARQAIQAAREAGADQSAAQELNEAQVLLELAEVTLKQQAYRDARRNALQAHGKAMRALNIAQADDRKPANR